MVEMAKLLAKSIKNKTVILTGAMIPIKFGSSDMACLIWECIIFYSIYRSGIYITMNSRYFKWDNVRKE